MPSTARPEGVYFEGAGDAIYDPLRSLMWMGYGQRSSRCAHHTVEQVFGIPTLSLELVDPHYYHLDTAFCLLSGGEILYHPAAFTEEGREQIRALAGGQADRGAAGRRGPPGGEFRVHRPRRRHVLLLRRPCASGSRSAAIACTWCRWARSIAPAAPPIASP